MAENSAIQWTHHTFNPWRGCTKVSEGCAHCYAEALSSRNPSVLGVWGPRGRRVVASESMWKEPLKWNRKAAKADERHRVFCASLADVFEDWQGPMLNAEEDEVCICYECGTWMLYTQRECACRNERAPRKLSMIDVRQRLWETINATPSLDWLLLTKRPENYRAMLPDRWLDIQWPSNVWLGVSVENQQMANARIPLLRQTSAAVRFLSCEPLLGSVDLNLACETRQPDGSIELRQSGIHWAIIGGESGSLARPCHVEWVRDLVSQCQAAGVAVFVKQLGGNVIHLEHPTDLRDHKGGDLAEWPGDLRIREFPA